MSGSDRNDTLGYGKPPKWTRFKKGQSGNPKGRPRKKQVEEKPLSADASDATLTQLMEREYQITENGRAIRIKGVEVIRRAQFKSATNGSPHAQRELLEDYRKLELKQAADAQRLAEDNEEMFEIYERLHQRKTMEWTDAGALGREPENPWPHPDDILLNNNRKAGRIRGPYDDSEVPRFEYFELKRDIAFAKSVYDHFYRRPRLKAPTSIWDPIWMMYNGLLPKRWQIRDVASHQMSIVLCNTARKLQKAIEADVRQAEILQPLAKLPPSDRETYKIVNTAMNPVLEKSSYHSVAQIQADLENGLLD